MPSQKSDVTLCSCSSSRDNLSEFPELQEILPSDYKYNVCNWDGVDTDCFECRFRVNVFTEMEACFWLKEFSAATNTVFKMEQELPKCKDVVTFSLRCKHITKGPLRRDEDTGVTWCEQIVCPTLLVIILKLPTFAENYGCHDDVHLRDFPMTVIQHQHHNHLLEDHSEGLSETQECILSSIAAVEIQLQKQARNARAAEERNHSAVQCYHEVLGSLFHANSAEKNLLLMFQKSAEISKNTESTTEERNHPKLKSYQEVLDSLLRAESDEEDSLLEIRLQKSAESATEEDNYLTYEILKKAIDCFFHAESAVEDSLLEVQFQQSAENSDDESAIEEQSHPAVKSYQEIIDRIYCAKSAEEYPTISEVDTDFLIDYYRDMCKPVLTSENETHRTLTQLPPINYKPLTMEMLPHKSVQEVFDYAVQKILNSKEVENTKVV